MNINFGYRIYKKDLTAFPKVVKGWGKAVNRYCDQGDFDAAYYHNERANVSMLAGGAWLANCSALEEFPNNKGWGKKKRKGRIDLYLSDGDDWCVVEAKQKYMNAIKTQKSFDFAVNKKISEAVDAAKICYGYAGKFGCVFFVPRFYKGDFRNYKKNAANEIKKIIERYLEIENVDILAWCFPKNNRTRHVHGEKSYYPGVILAIKEAK